MMASCQIVARIQPALLVPRERSANVCSAQRTVQEKSRVSFFTPAWESEVQGERTSQRMTHALTWTAYPRCTCSHELHHDDKRPHLWAALTWVTIPCCPCSSHQVSARPAFPSGPSGRASCAPSWLLRGRSSCHCSSDSARYPVVSAQPCPGQALGRRPERVLTLQDARSPTFPENPRRSGSGWEGDEEP